MKIFVHVVQDGEEAAIVHVRNTNAHLDEVVPVLFKSIETFSCVSAAMPSDHARNLKTLLDFDLNKAQIPKSDYHDNTPLVTVDLVVERTTYNDARNCSSVDYLVRTCEG